MPPGSSTQNVVGNLRAFMEYFRARISEIAQEEHTIIAVKMCIELEKKQPRFYKIIKSQVNGLEELVKKYREIFSL